MGVCCFNRTVERCMAGELNRKLKEPREQPGRREEGLGKQAFIGRWHPGPGACQLCQLLLLANQLCHCSPVLETTRKQE